MRFSFLLHAYFKFFGFSNVSGRLNKLRASRNRALVEWTNTKQKPQIGKQNIEMEMERGMYIVPDSIYRSMFWYFILKKILFLLRKTKKNIDAESFLRCMQIVHTKAVCCLQVLSK